MQITVFGASGRVGQRVVTEALVQGHSVVAFVHSRNPFTGMGDQNLTVVTGDVGDEAAIAGALSGSQAVISALGSWGTKHKNVLTSGMGTILPAMQSAGIDRIITVTGSGAVWSADKPKFSARLSRLAILCIAPRILRDGEAHIRALEASQLDWTCVRSPVMRDTAEKGYKLSEDAPSLLAKISYNAVAHCMVDLLGTTEYSRQAPYIH